VHWRIRFNRANGGGPESCACRFKPADADEGGVVSASDGVLELEGYPDLSWQMGMMNGTDGADPGFAKEEVIMMIHDFPPHKIFRRSHRPGRGPGETSIVLSADTAVIQRQQPLPHSGTWGWVIRNDNVTFWTYDPALVAAATAQKDAGNAHYRSGAHAEAMAGYLECLELLGANPLGCPHREWRRCALGRVRAVAEGDMHQISTSTPAIDPVTLFEDVNMGAGYWVPSNFWGCFRWNRTLADNHLHPHLVDDEDDRFAALVREEEDAYVELLTDEERTLHATALSNYAMAAGVDEGLPSLYLPHSRLYA
jgi:hypothetical protein